MAVAIAVARVGALRPALTIARAAQGVDFSPHEGVDERGQQQAQARQAQRILEWSAWRVPLARVVQVGL